MGKVSNEFRWGMTAGSLALGVLAWPALARAAPEAAAERASVGVGYGFPLAGPLVGSGLGGLGYGHVWFEPRLSSSLFLITQLSGNAAVARAGGESATSLWLAPGVGLRVGFADGALRPSAYVLATGSYARERFQGVTTRAAGGGGEVGLTLDGALSESVRLRASVALASVAHSSVLSADLSSTAARFGIAPLLGTAFVF